MSLSWTSSDDAFVGPVEFTVKWQGGYSAMTAFDACQVQK
jgi:hypothetical protein